MKIIHLDETNSTNEYVKAHINNLDDKTIVYTNRQTSGHGRLGRQWVDSGEDNLYMTMVLKPFEDLNPIYANFTQYLSVILSMVLSEEYGILSEIKWPNDVLIKGKKLAGILSEGTTQGGKFLGLALGIGVNLNMSEQNLKHIDRPAASISSEVGHYIDREEFLRKLLTKFFLLYDKFIDEGFLSVKDYYVERASFLGTKITINVLGNLHSGVAEGITDNGSLILKEDNNMNVYFIGDIL